MMERALKTKENYIQVFSDPKGSVYISLDAIKGSILNYLGERPTEDVRFVKESKPEEKITVSKINDKLIINIKLEIKADANISNNVYLVQEKVRTAIIEDTNLSPHTINVEIISNYGKENESRKSINNANKSKDK